MMRACLLALVLCACGPRPPAEEPQEPMPSAVLDKQDPTAHYEHYKKHGSWWSGLGFGNLFGGGPKPDSFYNPTNPPHYYTGCGGCSSDGMANALVVLAIAPLVLRRRRRTT